METQTIEITKSEKPWKRARDYIVESIGSLDRFETRDLWALCGLEYEPMPLPGESPTKFRRRATKSARLFAQYMAEIKAEVGENHKADLRATGVGAYEIVPHERHVRVAQRDTERTIRGALRDGVRRLDAFDTARADDTQRKEHADAMAHMHALQKVSGARRTRPKK